MPPPNPVQWVTLALLALASLTLAALLAGCAAATPLPATTPSAVCDARIVDLNRRLCAEHRGTFTSPGSPDVPPCGECR